MVNHRKKWIINKSFQHKFILVTTIPLCLLLCLFWAGIEISFHQMINSAKEIGLPQNHSFFIFLKEQKKSSLYLLFYLSIPTIIIYFCWAVIYSNKIAGPLYRLNLYFIDLKNTSTDIKPSLSFRKNDYFQELAKSINNFLQKK